MECIRNENKNIFTLLMHVNIVLASIQIAPET